MSLLASPPTAADMAEEVERIRRRLLLLDDIIDRLFDCRTKSTNALGLMEKKLEQMEELVSNLATSTSGHESGPDHFKIWSNRLLHLWARYAEFHRPVISAAAGGAGGSPSDGNSNGATSGHHQQAKSSSPSVQQPTRQKRTRSPSSEVNYQGDGGAGQPKVAGSRDLRWPEYHRRLERAFGRLSDVRSADDHRRLSALHDKVVHSFNLLIDHHFIGDHYIHKSVLTLALTKLPKSMVRAFKALKKESLKTLCTYLNGILQQTRTRSGDDRHQSSSTRRESPRDKNLSTANHQQSNSDKSSKPKSKSKRKKNEEPLDIPLPPPPPPPPTSTAPEPKPASTEATEATASAASVPLPPSNSVASNGAVMATIIKKEEPQEDYGIEEGELIDSGGVSSGQHLISAVAGDSAPQQSATHLPPPSCSSTTEDVTAIMRRLEAQFAHLHVVHTMDDRLGLERLIEALKAASEMIIGQPPELNRHLYFLAASLLSTNWYWGVSPKKQNVAFLLMFLKKKILDIELSNRAGLSTRHYKAEEKKEEGPKLHDEEEWRSQEDVPPESEHQEVSAYLKHCRREMSGPIKEESLE